MSEELQKMFQVYSELVGEFSNLDIISILYCLIILVLMVLVKI